MAIEYLKKGLDEKQRVEDNDKVKKIVEETLSKIESEGDKHIRAVSYTHLTLPTSAIV